MKNTTTNEMKFFTPMMVHIGYAKGEDEYQTTECESLVDFMHGYQVSLEDTLKYGKVEVLENYIQAIQDTTDITYERYEESGGYTLYDDINGIEYEFIAFNEDGTPSFILGLAEVSIDAIIEDYMEINELEEMTDEEKLEYINSIDLSL